MSRHGYSDDYGDDNPSQLALYRSSVDRALSGKRGQLFLKELAAAMDAMPVKELIAGELVAEDGSCCAIGVICKSRGLDISTIDYEDPQSVAKAVGIATAMAAEIEYENDEGNWQNETDGARWTRMRKWIDRKLGLTK